MVSYKKKKGRVRLKGRAAEVNRRAILLWHAWQRLASQLPWSLFTCKLTWLATITNTCIPPCQTRSVPGFTRCNTWAKFCYPCLPAHCSHVLQLEWANLTHYTVSTSSPHLSVHATYAPHAHQATTIICTCMPPCQGRSTLWFTHVGQICHALL